MKFKRRTNVNFTFEVIKKNGRSVIVIKKNKV